MKEQSIGKAFETEHNQVKKSERAWAELRTISDEICKALSILLFNIPNRQRARRYDKQEFYEKCDNFGMPVEYKPDQ